jgi:glutamate-ammonia-ligase adenylyltransferase
MDETGRRAAMTDAIGRARAHSPFLAHQLDRFPAIGESLAAHDLARALDLAAGAGGGSAVAAALRRVRSAHALALGVADLAGWMSLEDVTGALSDLADRTIARAIAAAFAERVPGEEPRGFAAIALGKLGGGELNYSSDVDLIFLYDPATLPRKPREEAGQAAVRLAQRVTELLQQRTEDGYAFRVDLRLRPSPEVTPIALPVDAAISYYESAALPWERAAVIRARFSAGDETLGSYFLDAIHPFVWRRSLDFGAIGEIQSISRLIRDHYAQGQAFGPGFDLKRGRGGIREVEFFIQIHQLIHGGRDPSLRAPATLAAIAALAKAERIDAEEAGALAAAYRALRTIEHRLQMVDDRQTHSLPPGEAALDNVARLHGLGDGAALLDFLRPHTERVSALYDRLGEGGGERLPRDAAGLEAKLAASGFPDPPAARARIEDWRAGKARSLRTPAAREAFEAMLPVLVAAFAGADDPMRAMNRFGDLVERVPSGVNLYRLLEARPALTQQLGAILSHAPALAERLGRRPELLDGLVDASVFAPPPPVPALAAEFARAGRPDETYEMMLDRVRRQVNERRFALGAQLVTGGTDPIAVGHGYARVAEAAIVALADGAVAAFEAAHGCVPGSELLILGLGRLGGGLLTHASDLDLVYLFSGTHEAESDGPKPLRATDYFNRLAPRVTAALSVPTAAGPLYEVDTRLRPSGRDGLLAVSVPSFETYQRESAWTFEHMALTRARPLYGSAEARAALEALIGELLRLPRDAARVREDALRMRAEIARHKPPAGALDVKLGEGGLVDLEFAVQVLQLTTGVGLTPDFEAALAALAAEGAIGPDIPEANRLLTRMLVTLRLVAPRADEPAVASRALVARLCGLGGWEELLDAQRAARQTICRLWRRVAGVEG